MTLEVCAGATLTCNFGVAPSTLLVTPEMRVVINDIPLATIMDFVPLKNITPFGVCTSPMNPTVIATTAAKLGVFTPAPCIPMTTQPWTPGASTVTVCGLPSLHQGCTLQCQWGGVITIANPGQTTIHAP